MRERRIPFEITAPEPELTRENAMLAFMNLRMQTKKNGVADMPLEEINEEIRRTRYGEEEAE